jgi:hypothetical protein
LGTRNNEHLFTVSAVNRLQNTNQRSVNCDTNSSIVLKHTTPSPSESKATLDMNAFYKQYEMFMNELDELREQLLVADANYENASTIVQRDVSDVDCNRLRAAIKIRQQLLWTLKENLRNESAPTPSTEFTNRRTQATGE